VKLPNRYDVYASLIVSAAVIVVVARWGWRAAHRGGFPFLSLATLEAIWPWLVLLAIAMVGAGLSWRKSK